MVISNFANGRIAPSQRPLPACLGTLQSGTVFYSVVKVFSSMQNLRGVKVSVLLVSLVAVAVDRDQIGRSLLGLRMPYAG